MRGRKGGGKTYGVTTEFRHDVFHCLFVFFEEDAELSVFMVESVVFDDNLGIGAFQFGFEGFCNIGDRK